MRTQPTSTWADQPVGDLVIGPAVSVDHRANLATVIETMADLGLGLLVVTENNLITGVVSARDVVWALSKGADPLEVWAGDIMTSDPTSIDHTTRLGDAVVTMATGSHRHIVVDGPYGVGVVSATDALSEIAMEIALASDSESTHHVHHEGRTQGCCAPEMV